MNFATRGNKGADPFAAQDEPNSEAWKDSEIQKLREELRVTDELLETRNRLLEAIPPCPVHGSQCVPHALDWIEERKAKDAIIGDIVEEFKEWDVNQA